MKITTERAAEMWCEINMHLTPKEFRRSLGAKWATKCHTGEAITVMKILALLTTKSKIDAAWKRLSSKP